MIEYGTSKVRTNDSAVAAWSRTLTPRNSTWSPNSSAVALRSGASTRQGGHAAYQRLMTTRRGRQSARLADSPLSRVKSRSSGSPRSASVNWVMTPAPET
jgi:hypothetical protein